MKIAKLNSFNDIRIEDIPIPRVGPGDALIKTRACGVCSGDVMPWYIEKKAPLVPGHEIAGEVVSVGEKVTHFRTGNRVFTHHHAPCLSCRFCRRGDYVQCYTWKKSSLIPGGISEYILIPALNLENDTITLADTVSFEDATLVEPAACVVKGLKRAKIRRGDTVLVIGLGVMGMIHVLLAKEYGAGRVIGADMVPYRLEKAIGLGADHVIDVTKKGLVEGLKDITGGDLAELVIAGPNSAEVMMNGIECIQPGGQIVLFTPAKPGEMLRIDPNKLYFKDINILTSYSCGPSDTADAYEFIERRIVTAEKLVTHRFPIEQTAEAFRITSLAADSLKSLIVFE